MFDYHVHSEYSADCTMPMEEAIEKAILLGIKELAFTDHIDLDYPDEKFDFFVDYHQYVPHFQELKEKYKSKIKLRLGVEIGLQEHVYEPSEELILAHPFDFILASTHVVQKKDLHNGEYFDGKTANEANLGYYQAVLHGIENFSHFSVYGHIDLIKRYRKFFNLREINYQDYLDIVDQILKALIYKGKGIEINTSGYRYGIENSLPDLQLISRYKELGGEIITTGSDAHHVNHIGDQFEIVYALLQKAGFKYITTFENQKPIFNKFI